MKMAVYWDAVPCNLMVEKVATSETSVSFYQIHVDTTITSVPFTL
jgi:hypothetical protein